jgi:hypothetical protein
MDVPLPKTLKILRGFLASQIRADRSTNNSHPNSPDSHDVVDHLHLKWQLLCKNLLRISPSSGPSANENTVHHQMQFFKLLVDSCLAPP